MDGVEKKSMGWALPSLRRRLMEFGVFALCTVIHSFLRANQCQDIFLPFSAKYQMTSRHSWAIHFGNFFLGWMGFWCGFSNDLKKYMA